MQYIQGQTTLDKPPPCSPKVIYSLAVAVSWSLCFFVSEVAQRLASSLRSRVFASLHLTTLNRKLPQRMSSLSFFLALLVGGRRHWFKLSPSLHIRELTTYRQSDIARMQCGLLYYKFNNDTTASQGMEFIEGMLGGNSGHRANAVKLVLREGLLSGVFLRCPDENCDLHDNTTPYHLLESSIRCPRHNSWGSGVFTLVCGGCGTSRTNSEDTSCQGCKKRLR